MKTVTQEKLRILLQSELQEQGFFEKLSINIYKIEALSIWLVERYFNIFLYSALQMYHFASVSK